MHGHQRAPIGHGGANRWELMDVPSFKEYEILEPVADGNDDGGFPYPENGVVPCLASHDGRKEVLEEQMTIRFVLRVALTNPGVNSGQRQQPFPLSPWYLRRLLLLLSSRLPCCSACAAPFFACVTVVFFLHGGKSQTVNTLVVACLANSFVSLLFSLSLSRNTPLAPAQWPNGAAVGEARWKGASKRGEQPPTPFANAKVGEGSAGASAREVCSQNVEAGLWWRE